MARSAKQASHSITLNQKVAVKITPARFKTFAATRHLDAERLQRVAHERIEVGYFETDCCRRLVHAVVKKGMVTKIELEPCAGEVRSTPEMSKLIQMAKGKLGQLRSSAKQFPVPVHQFLAQPEELVVHVWGCISICIFGYCILCCYDVGVGKPWGMCKFTTEAKA